MSVEKLRDELIDFFSGLYAKRDMAKPGLFAVKFGFLMAGLGDLNTEVGVAVRRIEMVPVGDDRELQEREKRLPEIERLVLVGNVDPDVPQIGLHDFTVALKPDLPQVQTIVCVHRMCHD